ncbi:MAG: EAL domain-containing protein [Pseudomonadales bacterium]|nr:EAL domain-containing protein [Pseudomonadales bacterium]
MLVLNLFQWSRHDKNNADARDATSNFVAASFLGKVNEYRDSMIAATSRISNAYSFQRLTSPLPDNAVEITAIDSYLEGAKLDFMFIFDSKGSISLAREYDFYRNVSQPLSDNNKALAWEVYQQLPEQGGLDFGVLYVGPEPIYVAINAITDNKSGDVAHIIAGSYLSTLIRHIEGTLDLNIEYAFYEEMHQGASREMVAVSVDTILGNPLTVTLRIENEAAITPATVMPLWGLWAGLILAISLGGWLFVYRPIFGGIIRVMDQLNAIQMEQKYSGRLEVAGSNEFSHLSTRINGVLSTLEYAYNLLRKNSEVTSGLINEVASQRELENIKDKDSEERDDAELPVRAEERLHMVSRLSRAIEREDISVVFQPQYETIGQEITSLTALARWEDEELGKVPPCQFVALAEDSSLMGPLGKVLIKTACIKAKSWQNAGFKPVPVACKLSSSQFNNKNLLAIVVAALAGSRLEPRYLELEIKEQVLMENTKKAIEILTTLSHIGVRLVIDDYIGQGGVGMLKLLPVSKIKLDSSFVADVAENKKDASLVEGVVKLGNSLGLEVIAAGIETEAQLKALQSNNGNVGLQGFYMGRPVSSSEIIPRLSRIAVTRLKVVQ